MSYISTAEVFGVTISLTGILMVLFGGAGTIFGPVIGAFIFQFLSEVIWSQFLEYHLGILGIVTILVIFFIPRGILTSITEWIKKSQGEEASGGGEMSTNGFQLKIEGVSKHFGALRAVDEVSFDVKDGELIGLIGPNGAGKTTLLNLITGTYRKTKGSVEFENRDISTYTPDQVAKVGIARTFQITKPLVGNDGRGERHDRGPVRKRRTSRTKVRGGSGEGPSVSGLAGMYDRGISR